MTPEKRAEFEAKIYAFVGRDVGEAKRGPDPVNAAMIRHWAEVMEDELDIYVDENASTGQRQGIVAPPAMLQVWSMEGYPMAGAPGEDAQRDLHKIFDEYGFTGVLGTNTSTEFYRDLRPGDEVHTKTVIDTISPQKATSRGIGYFIETVTQFADQHDEPIGKQVFRVLKFIPDESIAAAKASASDEAPALPTRIASPRGQDNGWWWDAIDEGKLLIQRCKSCGALRHPTRPMCGECGSTEWDSIEASMKGEIYSFTTVHYPKVPGYDYPNNVAIIALEEGTRLVANIVDSEADDLKIGMPVLGSIEQVDDATRLPVFRIVKD